MKPIIAILNAVITFSMRDLKWFAKAWDSAKLGSPYIITTNKCFFGVLFES